jgi:DNA polymerase-3 subunit alpha
MSYIPLNCKTHYSVLEAYQKPKDISSTLDRLDISRCGIAEFQNMSSSVKALQAMPNTILSYDSGDALLYAKNLTGWYELVKINNGVMDYREAENIVTVYTKPVKDPVKDAWFGIDYNSGNQDMRACYDSSRCVATPQFLASNKQDQLDFHVVMGISQNKSMDNLREDNPEFFKKDWYMKDYNELLEIGYTKQELSNTYAISEMCENIVLPNELQIPVFDSPEGYDSNGYLKFLCNEGFYRLGLEGNQEYIDRIKQEMLVIEKYNLEDYFLIIRDIVNYINEKFGLSGVRGSAAGCLLSYLIDITKTDPIKHNLSFARFLNEGRFSEGRVQPPDIDVDIPSEARAETIKWIREKYTEERSGQILTYQTIKSPAAIKAVFRVNNTLPFHEINAITKQLPPDHVISDKLKESGESSVIMWCLKHSPERLSQWATYSDKSGIQGRFKKEFEQAVRLEGTNSARSKHAAGIIVSKEKLTETCPLLVDPVSGSKICGMEMNDLESGLGLLKLDLLGLRHLDKMLDIYRMLNK